VQRHHERGRAFAIGAIGHLTALLGVALTMTLLLVGVAHADIYWGNYQDLGGSGPDYIGHARLDGSEANAQLLDIKGEKPVGLAADGSFIYAAFPGPSGGSIGRANLQGGEPNADFIYGPGKTPLSGADGIVVAGNYVYWTNGLERPNGVPAEIGRAPITGGEGEPEFINLGGDEDAMDLAVSGEHLYWSEGTSIGRANVNGSEIEPDFVENEPSNHLGFVFGLAANAGHLYWSHNVTKGSEITGAIGQMNLDGGEIEPELVPGLHEFDVGGDMTLDSNYLYWDTEHAIARAGVEGGGANEDFIPNAGNPAGLTVDHRIIVNSAAEYTDAAPGDGTCAASKANGGVCTLRAAIEEVNAEKKTIRATIGVEIPGGKLETLKLTEPLPKIEVPVVIDARSQSGALVAGTRTIGLIIDGSKLPTEPPSNGIELGAGAKTSVLAGLQIQSFTGDGVLLEGEDEQVGDSVLTKDIDGAEIAGINDIVGITEGVAGDIFFEDGRPNLLGYLKGLQGKHETGENFQKGLSVFGSGVELVKGTSGARIDGDYIGVHGEGFETGADKLAPDGLKEFKATSGIPIGVLIAPTAAGGAISDVEIGAPGIGADVITANIFGVLALGDEGTPINELAIYADSFGAGVKGEELEPFGGLFGVLAGGSIENLKVGYNGEGDTFQGLLVGAALDGTGLKAPLVQSNTFGVAHVVGKPEHGIGLHDGVGLMLSDVEGATIGGGSGLGNSFPGTLIGMTLAGEHLNNDTISGNTIGTAPEKPFTSFEQPWEEYDTAMGILSLGLFSPVKTAGHALTLEHNTIQGTMIGLTTDNVKGLQMFGNTLENNAFAMLDSGSGDAQIGGSGAGQGNSFLNDGIGLFESNEEPNSAELGQATVNPEDAKPSTRQKLLSVPDDEAALATVDAISTAELSSTSANTSAQPGSENALLGNRFGVSATGVAQPDQLPVLIAGDEHGLRFGGTGAGEGNIVEDNGAGGLIVGGTAGHYPSVQVLGNTIYNNENFLSPLPIPGLGINLVAGEALGYGVLGVDPQDPTQPDNGPNGLQNSPILTAAGAEAGTVTVSGGLRGIKNTNYVIEVFAGERQNPFGAGEGQTLLGRLAVSTGASGEVGFKASFADPGATYRYISSTATTVPALGEPGVTSEFSVNQAITRPGTTTTATTTTTPTTSTTTTTAGKGAATTTVASTGSSATTGGTSVTLPATASCSSATSTPCTVTSTATIPGSSASTTSVVATVAAKKHIKNKAPLRIGAGSMTLAPGATAPVRLTLSARGLALLHASHTLAVTVTVKVSGKGRPTVTRVLHLKLKYKKQPTKKTKPKRKA
jgi:hypothetical protein